MRWSQTLIPTLRDDPAGVSQIGIRWLVRGGFLRRIEPAGFVVLPLLVRVLDTLHNRLAEALVNAGGCHIQLAVRPPDAADVSKTTGEQKIRPEREVVLSFVQHELRSYRQLPFSLFHLSNAEHEALSVGAQVFGDRRMEVLIFARDDTSVSAKLAEFEQAVRRVLDVCELTMISAVSGRNQVDLVVFSNSVAGDRFLLTCPTCSYCATHEAAVCPMPVGPADEEVRSATPVSTPGMRTVEEVTAFLGVPAQRLAKTLLYATEGGMVGALIRGDRILSESKFKRLLGVDKLDLLNAERIREVTGAAVGFSGPVGLKNVRLIADIEVPLMQNFVVGGNADDMHLINVNPRDFGVEQVADLRCAVEGDPCPICTDGNLRAQTGSLIGSVHHQEGDAGPAIFFDDEDGSEREVVSRVMHIDLSAILLAVVENHHDDRGVIWPAALAPFGVHLMAIGAEDETQRAACEKLEKDFQAAGIDILYDDRPLRPGVRFYDADLTGIPVRIIVGPKRLADGEVEISHRTNSGKGVVPLDEAVAYTRSRLQAS